MMSLMGREMAHDSARHDGRVRKRHKMANDAAPGGPRERKPHAGCIMSHITENPLRNLNEGTTSLHISDTLHPCNGRVNLCYAIL